MSERLTILVGDVFDRLRELESESVHCVVTSPPYWALRDYGTPGQLGLEPVLDCLGWATGSLCGACYICRMTAVFGEVKRVLRKDGVCFVNMGDSYAGGSKGSGGKTEKQTTNAGSFYSPVTPAYQLPPKNLCMVPARLALSIQADGWILRSDVIWHKPNPMPESVTDRFTKAHEFIFLFAKSERYFFDAESVREPLRDSTLKRYQYGWNGQRDDGSHGARTGSAWKKMSELGMTMAEAMGTAGRNRRDVFTIPPAPYPEAHFATYPPDLIRPLILAGTSERGCCPKCGKCWERVVERQSNPRRSEGRFPSDHRAIIGNGSPQGAGSGSGALTPTITTTGWRPGCLCDAGDPQPCTVLDPFLGAGTTALVALEYNRRCIGIELNPEYAEMARRRCAAVEAQGVLSELGAE